MPADRVCLRYSASNNFTDVFHQFTDTLWLFGVITGFVRSRWPSLAPWAAQQRRRHYNGLGAGFNGGHPGVDVVAPLKF